MNINPKLQSLFEDLNRGCTPKFGFLHIPKTGGSGILDLSNQLIASSHTCPILFSHNWTLEEVFFLLPNIQLSFILRDPIERIVSGFNSRLRQGRPRLKDQIWSMGEATAFSLFQSPIALLDAIISDDEYKYSAAQYALNNIQHLKRGYEFYFQNLQLIKKFSKQLYHIGDINDMQHSILSIFQYSGAKEDEILDSYQATHISTINTSSICTSISDDQRNALRKHFSKEYEIYNALMNLLTIQKGEAEHSENLNTQTSQQT